MRSRRIAVLADCATRRLLLHQLLTDNGWQVVFSTNPEQLDESTAHQCHADLWLIALESADLPGWLDNSKVPLLFAEGLIPDRHSERYLPWERRLLHKLNTLTATTPVTLKTGTANHPGAARIDSSCAQQVWLLAASTGGPSAVKNFLDALPVHLPIALLYAQHIDAQFESTLPQVIGRHNRWKIGLAQQYQRLYAGEVTIVPVARELRFAEGGSLHIEEHPWQGVWQPSFKRMMQNLVRHFGSRCGVIVFSGMDNDCTAVAAWMKRQGVPIWTQSEASCVCPAMPASLRRSGYSQKSGTPAQLAKALAEHLQPQHSTLPLPVESP